jgi:hypothetical protein
MAPLLLFCFISRAKQLTGGSGRTDDGKYKKCACDSSKETEHESGMRHGGRR